MDILEVAKDKLGFDSKRYTTLLFVCSIALAVSLMILIMYQNQLFDLTGGYAKAEKSRNVTALKVDSKNDSSPPAIIPDGRLHNGNLPPGFGNGTRSENNSLRHISGTDKQLNGTLAPGFWIESGSRNDSFGNGTSSKNNSLPHTIGPDEKQLNGTLAPAFWRESGTRNDSFGNGTSSKNNSLPRSSGPDEKQLDGTLAPGFQKESGSRNDSSQSNRMPDDILLDGLLAPGFDERSCVSRYQSFLFRKTSPHKPSSYLVSKLRRYEDLHKRCGPHTKSYSKALKGLKSNHGSSTGGCKYIVWIPANGLGNRMVSIASTFLYALLTNRVLLVKLGNDMPGLFCEPFPNSSWNFPKKFNHEGRFHSPDEKHARGYGNLLKNGIINESMELPPSYVYLNLDHSTYDLDKLFFYCNQSPPLLQKIPWLFLISDQYFAPSFFLTPTFKQEVERLFPEKETVFHHLARYIFHPTNEVWGLITRFYEAYLANADERIGLQIRVFNTETSPVEIVLDQLLKCTQKEKLLPQVDTKNPVATPSKNQISKAILVTSLYTKFYENISNTYWAKPTVTGEVIGVYQPSHEEFQHRGDNMHNMKAWAEMYLLSLSDVLVTSAWSTFGYVAQGLGGLKPWILYKADKKNTPNPSCVRDLSMEPCFHFPPSYDCKTKAKINVGTLFPCLKYCEDLNWGLKLVSDQN